MVTQITQQFQVTFSSMLTGKLYFFRRRSLWRYLLAALLFSLAKPELVNSFWSTLLVLTVGFVGLGLLSVVLGSYTQRRQSFFEGIVTFQATGLEVRPANGATPETHDWHWVREFGEDSRRFFLVFRPFPRLVLLLDKRRLTAEEVDAFRTWVANRNS
jgi:hypothetical protein